MPITDPTSDPLFEVPAGLSAPMYQVLQAPTVASITTGVGGSGVFDTLMVSMKAHLGAEYDKGRITGAEYTKAYIELTTAVLQTSLQFTLGKDLAFWQAQQIQVGTIAGRVALENAKVQFSTSQYTLSTMLPAQLALINEQREVQRAQTLGVRSDGQTVAGSIGKQVQLYDQQITSYKRDAEVKAAKCFTDAWLTSKTLDNTLAPPVGFTNSSIDEVLTVLKTNNSL